MLTRRTFAAVLASTPGAAAAGPAAAGAGLSRDGIAEIAHTMDVARVPALTYALIEDGRIVEAPAVGLRKAGGSAVDDETLFDAASLTKPVFATAILDLVDHGVIDLDRPLQGYLPLFDDPMTAEITARHVLSHTTGLPNWRFKAADPLRSAFKPGSRWSYSGEAHYLLLRVAEHLTGEPLGEMLEKRVFAPAGMSRSTVGWTDAVAANLAWPHDNNGDPIEERGATPVDMMARAPFAVQIGTLMARWTTDQAMAADVFVKRSPIPDNTLPNPAFGLWTTARDYGRFLIYAARRKDRAAPCVRLRGDLAWGLGWGLELGADGPFAWQWGDANGVKNLFMLHLPSRSGLVVLTNGDNGARVYRRLTRKTFAREFDALLWV